MTLHSLYSFPVLAGYLLARLHRKSYGIWPHGVLAPFQRQISVRKKWLYNRLFANRILQNASVIFFSAEGERKEANPLELRSPSVIVPDGFSADEFAKLPSRGSFRDRYFNGHDGPLVLFLARLQAKKGLDLLIKAMQSVINERPDTRLAIVGPPDPPEMENRLKQWIKEGNIDAQTVLTGMAGPALRLQALTDADLFVLPSHAENFGFSVFEAMACGVPVLVSETLNYAAEIAECGAGLALPRTPEAFSAAILELTRRPDLRRAMGDMGKQFVLRFSLEETGAKVAQAITSIVEQRPFPLEIAPVTTRGI